MSLKAESVSYSYSGSKVQALGPIELEITKGELAVICGKNGSGKSTLLRCLAGLAKPSQGRVTIDGKAAERSRRSIGFAIQFPERALFERTVYEEVAFGPRNMGLPADDVKKLTDVAIESVGICRDLLAVNPRTLSYGEKRLVAIACAIAHGPGYLFLDEPAAGLDSPGRRRMIGIIRSINASGKTIVVASHDPQDLLDKCNRVIVLDSGKMIANGSPSAEKLAMAGISSDTLELARCLRERGMNIGEAFSPEALADSIAGDIR